MAKLLAVLCIGAVVTMCSAQIGPSRPHAGTFCGEEGNKAVDALNMCWYHECTVNSNGLLTFLPRRCALGSKVSYNFVEGMENPCTVNFDSVIGYDCGRNGIQSVDGPPPCHDPSVRIQCFNGGVATYEAEKCWCDCPPSWRGDSDCSKPTRNVANFPGLVQGGSICVDGQPQEDFCAFVNGCLNRGVCYNQCDTFWCDCPDHENNNYIGKRCERR